MYPLFANYEWLTSKNTKFWVKYPHHMYVISTNRKEIYIRFLWTFYMLPSLSAKKHFIFFPSSSHFSSSWRFFSSSAVLHHSRYITIFMDFDMYICYKDIVEDRRLKIKLLTTIHSFDQPMVKKLEYTDFGFIWKEILFDEIDCYPSFLFLLLEAH